MKLYIAGSLANREAFLWLVAELRAEGYIVFNFIEHGPPSAQSGEDFTELASLDFEEFVQHPLVNSVCNTNFEAIRSADVVILLLPAGVSAHLEVGLAKGLGKICFMLYPYWLPESRDIVYCQQVISKVFRHPAELLAALAGLRSATVERYDRVALASQEEFQFSTAGSD